MPIFLILHDIRSSENVGSIFRTADAAGVSKIYLTGYTPAPLDRFNRPNAKIAKSALGAQKTVSYKPAADVYQCITTLKQEGVQVVAVEQSLNSVPYTEFKLKKPTAFVLGNEVEGLSEKILREVDTIVEIPMRGKKESLNVAVSAGIVLFNCISPGTEH